MASLCRRVALLADAFTRFPQTMWLAARTVHWRKCTIIEIAPQKYIKMTCFCHVVLIVPPTREGRWWSRRLLHCKIYPLYLARLSSARLQMSDAKCRIEINSYPPSCHLKAIYRDPPRTVSRRFKELKWRIQANDCENLRTLAASSYRWCFLKMVTDPSVTSSHQENSILLMNSPQFKYSLLYWVHILFR